MYIFANAKTKTFVTKVLTPEIWLFLLSFLCSSFLLFTQQSHNKFPVSFSVDQALSSHWC